jgi:hypothetical protein
VWSFPEEISLIRLRVGTGVDSLLRILPPRSSFLEFSLRLKSSLGFLEAIAPVLKFGGGSFLEATLPVHDTPEFRYGEGGM